MRKIVKVAFFVVSVVFAGYGVYISQGTDSMSALALANIEALARYELPEVEITCDSDPGRCWVISGRVCVRYGKTWPDCDRVSATSANCSTPCD